MSRCLLLAVSVALLPTTPLLAQAHPPTHDQQRQHGQAGHEAIDPKLHAAMHTLLPGHWHGTTAAAGGATGTLNLVVARDQSGNMTLTMSADHLARVGSASDVKLEGNSLRWTQVVSGTPCQAKAILGAAASGTPATMTGTMACGKSALSFKLEKTEG